MFVLTSSYTASLSSLLTVQKLRSDRDIEWLKQNNLSVGCANASTFVKDYLVQVHNFPLHQVVYIQDEHELVDKFKNKKISAFIVESPYEKALLNKHCKGYTATTAASKFGGMGFVSAYNFFFGMFTFIKCFAFILFFSFLITKISLFQSATFLFLF